MFTKWRKKKIEHDQCVVIECLPEAVQGTLCSRDEAEKKLTATFIKKFSHGENDVWQAVLKTFKAINTKNTPTALLLDSKYGKTTHTTVALLRQSLGKAAITEQELEDMIAAGLWKILNRERERVAEFFNISAIDVEIVDACVIGIRLDGHRVISPVGFSARTVEFEVVITYMPLSLAQTFRDVFSEVNFQVVAEAGVLWAGYLATLETKDFFFAPVMPTYTPLIERSGASIRYLDSIKWGSERLLKVVETEFGVEEQIALKIMDLYRSEHMSTHLLTKTTRLLSEELHTLVNVAKSHEKYDVKAKFYVTIFMDIPQRLVKNAFKQRRGKSPSVMVFNREFLGEQSGFQVQLIPGQSLDQYLSFFLGALSLQSHRVEPLISKLTKRRVRWMHQ